ncbi:MULTISPECIES: nucleotide exchange factor GrpE [Streptomyces]|uniref:nucleotide exchange factor GrpE n=1 Tax=Streptomyces TaxID=1883 RepID=UPI001CCDBA5B|nr:MULTISPECIES: nucleotide exchange factor GrpE [Streptomyces]UBI36122.1 nucleotide exchange factor GrpE [Streptomyces mobaraensis]UKW28717.1 nucleotide exchange factor GrpE [Streptomyces sp. TYQ1024]
MSEQIELCSLAAEFTEALARQQRLAERREAIVTRLHDEVERLRQGEVEAALDLVRHSLIRLHDQILRQAEHVTGPLGVDELRALLTALADEAADTVARTGVERYVPRPGEAFDRTLQRPVGRVAAASPEAERTVARVVAAGFVQGERVVRKADVVVSRWEPDAPPNASSPAATSTPASPSSPEDTGDTTTHQDN